MKKKHLFFVVFLFFTPFPKAQNKTITANFTINAYTLNVISAHGTVLKVPDQTTYNHGTSVVLTATASTGYIFTGWSGSDTSTSNPLTITMTSNKKIIANYTPAGTFVLNVTAVNGTVKKNPDLGSSASGASVLLTATASTGYTFTGWTGDATGNANPLSITIDQNVDNYELGVGLRFQKTEQLYWENGVGADFTSDFLLHKKIHLKLSYATSRIGSAFLSNAIRQDNYVIGADWRFRSTKDFQIFAGLNTGFFHADMETAQFNVLPHNSMLFSLETGLFYKFKFPLATSLSVGYNLINGDGLTVPGSLFPVFYQLSVFYYIGKK